MTTKTILAMFDNSGNSGYNASVLDTGSTAQQAAVKSAADTVLLAALGGVSDPVVYVAYVEFAGSSVPAVGAALTLTNNVYHA